MEYNKIKVRLIDTCTSLIKERIKLIEGAIANAQKEANEHKGAMESRYDTFKEEAQYLREGYEKQLAEALMDLSIINHIPNQGKGVIQLGSIIETIEKENDSDSILKYYFVSISAPNGTIEIDYKEYTCLKYISPLITAIKPCKIGDEVIFRGKRIRILNIY